MHGLFQSSRQPSAGLTAPFSEDEVKRLYALWIETVLLGQMGLARPSSWQHGPLSRADHGFHRHFYSGSVQLERINRSYMVLFPKKPGATTVDAFRPICLQNCTIKILAKSLTCRLQRKIGNYYNWFESDRFSSRKTISETFIFAAEIVQTCNKRKDLTSQRHSTQLTGRAWTPFSQLGDSMTHGGNGWNTFLNLQNRPCF